MRDYRHQTNLGPMETFAMIGEYTSPFHFGKVDPEIVKLNKYFEEFKLNEKQKKEEVLYFLKYGHFKRDQQKQFHEMLRKAYPNITDEIIGFWDQLSLHETREKR